MANFKESYNRLKEIKDILQSDEIIDIDKINKLQKEAKKLYEECQNILQNTTPKQSKD